MMKIRIKQIIFYIKSLSGLVNLPLRIHKGLYQTCIQMKLILVTRTVLPVPNIPSFQTYLLIQHNDIIHYTIIAKQNNIINII